LDCGVHVLHPFHRRRRACSSRSASRSAADSSINSEDRRLHGFLSREIQTFVSGKKATTTPHASRFRLAEAARTAHYQIPGNPAEKIRRQPIKPADAVGGFDEFQGVADQLLQRRRGFGVQRIQLRIQLFGNRRHGVKLPPPRSSGNSEFGAEKPTLQPVTTPLDFSAYEEAWKTTTTARNCRTRRACGTAASSPASVCPSSPCWPATRLTSWPRRRRRKCQWESILRIGPRTDARSG